jgi:DNA-binding NtrC family response regulator
VDCGAIPANLLENELFGHERGAFTGADRPQAGAFQAASGGTLLLDEIGELALDVQPKLLRALETRKIQKIGSTKREPVDVRIIAATNRNLRREVNAGRFRSDLYYRLAVLEVALPPLRERLEDLPLIVEELLSGMAASGSRAAQTLRTDDFLAELKRHVWPGNVRELRNYLERCLAFEGKAPLAQREEDADDPLAIDVGQPLRVLRERWLVHLQRRYLEELLRHHNQNVSDATRAAGIARVHFYRLMSRCGIRRMGDPGES